jgi:hypothetical protein
LPARRCLLPSRLRLGVAPRAAESQRHHEESRPDRNAEGRPHVARSRHSVSV